MTVEYIADKVRKCEAQLRELVRNHGCVTASWDIVTHNNRSIVVAHVLPRDASWGETQMEALRIKVEDVLCWTVQIQDDRLPSEHPWYLETPECVCVLGP